MTESSSGGTPDLFTKVGPLPAWGWGAIAVFAYLLYNHFKSASTAVTPAVIDGYPVDPNAIGDPNAGLNGSLLDGTGLTDPSAAGYNYNDVLTGSYQGSTGGTQYATNQQWAVTVVNDLSKMGYPPATVISAIAHYLAGDQLTADESAIVNAAILNYGSPPLPVPVNGNLPSVPTQGGVPPTSQPPPPATKDYQQFPVTGAPSFTIDPATGMGHALPGITPAADAINSLGLDPSSPAALAIRETAGVNDAIDAGKAVTYFANKPYMNNGTAAKPQWVPVPLGSL